MTPAKAFNSYVRAPTPDRLLVNDRAHILLTPSIKSALYSVSR